MNIIVASSKKWNSSGFDNLKSRYEEYDWNYVEDPSELVRAIELNSPEYVFFLHWNWIVPEIIWRKHECICFHMTDLPYGRGGSPLQNLIVRGHKDTQLTALRMIAEVDAGPIYRKLPLSLDGTAEEIYQRAGCLSYKIIEWMLTTVPKPEAVQQIGDPTYFKRRSPEQGELPLTGSLNDLYDHIRMLDAPSYPPAFIEHGEFIIEIYKANTGYDELTASIRIHKKPESELS